VVVKDKVQVANKSSTSAQRMFTCTLAPHLAPSALAHAFVYCATIPNTPPVANHVTHLSNSQRKQDLTANTIAVMTTFEPSLSTTMRASSHDAPSMADQLPSINFGFDDLRSRMNQFTARFDAFIENGRRRVLEERNQFRMNVAELHGTRNLTLPPPLTPVLTTPQRTSA
jgi:hypothetical protein